MTLFELLQQAGLPVIAVNEANEVTMGVMTLDQVDLYRDVLLQFFQPELYQDLVQERLERQDLKAQLVSVLNTLDTIANAQSPTQAQIVAAVQFEATMLRKLLKFMARNNI